MESIPRRRHVIETGNSVASFVCALCPAPPVARTRRFNCLAEATPLAPHRFDGRVGAGSACSYWKHSHRSAVFHHQRTRLAPETTPATAFVARLSMFFTVTVTLGGRQRRPVVQACHQAPARASFAALPGSADFGGRNTEASPLPILFNILPSGFVSVAADWQGLSPRSSLSFSRSAFWAETRARSSRGSSVLPPGNSRRQRVFIEPDGPCTRMAMMALVPMPTGGFQMFLGAFVTRFEA